MEGYSRIKLVGKGSFGAAYLVTRKRDGLKFIEKEIRLSGMPRQEQEAAKKEVQLLRNLDHPNVVKYIDHAEKMGTLHIVMEYADGGDLYSRLKKQMGRRMSEKDIMMYFTQLCLALRHLHDKRILHRDLKTQNVFLTSSGVVKLGDFGISTVLKNTFAVAHTICGTPYYFSPELCLNKPYNNKTDVWSLGCILYELTTLNHAFDGANMKALMQKIVKGVFPPIPSSYSPELSNLINKMLAREPSQRPNMHTILSNPFVRKYVEALATRVQECAAKPAAPLPLFPRQPEQQQPQQQQPQVLRPGGGAAVANMVAQVQRQQANNFFRPPSGAPAGGIIPPANPAPGVGLPRNNAVMPDAALIEKKKKEMEQRNDFVKQMMAKEVKEYDEKIKRQQAERDAQMKAAQEAQKKREEEAQKRREVDAVKRKELEKQREVDAIKRKEAARQREMEWERNMKAIAQEQKDRQERLMQAQQDDQQRKLEQLAHLKAQQNQNYTDQARQAFFEGRRQAEENRKRWEDKQQPVDVPKYAVPKQQAQPAPPVSSAQAAQQAALDAEKRREVFWANRREAEANRARLKAAVEGRTHQITEPEPAAIMPPALERARAPSKDVSPPPPPPCEPEPQPQPQPQPEPQEPEEEEESAEVRKAAYDKVLKTITDVLAEPASEVDDPNDDFEDEAQDADSGPNAAINKFVLDGQTLHLPNVKQTDPLGYRIEVLREFLENKMGDAFYPAFNALDEVDSDTNDDTLAQLERKLGPEMSGFLGLVSQLVLCVEEFNRKQS
eukprot:PhM_4_TR16994/c1_g1_i1/m.97444/K08857/NEK1_4_5; NIMA (never in mitosis gene a)-related kinase 1/4/5